MVALVLLVLAGQVVAVADAQARPWIVAASILVLSLVGARYGGKAGRAQATGRRMSWWLLAGGRVVSAVNVIALKIVALRGATAWWWVGTTVRLPMFLLFAAGILLTMIKPLRGRRRHILLAEITTVLAAALMLLWSVPLGPISDEHPAAHVWTVTICSRLGDLILLAAIAAVVLRGAATRYSRPLTLFAVGLSVYLLSDLVSLATGVYPGRISDSPFTWATVVLANLLLTLSSMLAAAQPGQPHQIERNSTPPRWATHLPMAAVTVGCTLMLTVLVLEGHLQHRDGLVGGLIILTCAGAVRQLLSVRDSRDLIVRDPLTGLANRTGLDYAIERARKRGEPTALLLIDLDGVKLVNDAYGHTAGDTVLIEFGHQLSSAVHSTHLPARVGGDEFAVLLTGITTAEHATAVATRILAGSAASPVHLDDDRVPLRASIGIALAQPDDSGRELLRRAGVAMYLSKRTGNHTVTMYDPSMIDRRAEDAALSDDLDTALDRGELYMVYQPQVDLADGRAVAAEALIRWQHPTRGLLSPVVFIPVAERSGAILRIGLWTLEQALLQLRTIQDHAPAGRPMHISVNLSPRQLREATIVPDILAILRRCGVDPRHLVLEVTESAIVDESSGIAALRALRSHGIRIAIDDFGTGYSSLQYLSRLPVDILKIDRSFVADLNGTAEGCAVTEAIVRLSQALHLSTVAEGIETPAQALELQMLGCDTGQGYLFARPLAATDLTTMITTARPATPKTAASLEPGDQAPG
jgi:diguanylate cyclase (GGDEF)-like protein